MRSTPEQDARLRLRLAAAVDQFAGGSADKFGQLVGYANGGYIREVLNQKKPVREKLIERVHGAKGMGDWFTSSLTVISRADVAPGISAKAQEIARLFDRIDPALQVHVEALVNALQPAGVKPPGAAPYIEPTRPPLQGRQSSAESAPASPSVQRGP